MLLYNTIDRTTQQQVLAQEYNVLMRVRIHGRIVIKCQKYSLQYFQMNAITHIHCEMTNTTNTLLTRWLNFNNARFVKCLQLYISLHYIMMVCSVSMFSSIHILRVYALPGIKQCLEFIFELIIFH